MKKARQRRKNVTQPTDGKLKTKVEHSEVEDRKVVIRSTVKLLRNQEDES